MCALERSEENVNLGEDSYAGYKWREDEWSEQASRAV